MTTFHLGEFFWFFFGFYNILQTIKHFLVFLICFRPRLRVFFFKGACHHCLVSVIEVPEIVQLAFTMELLAISFMSEVSSEHKVCFRASQRHRRGC